MKKAWVLLRSVAAGVIMCAIAAAPGASAHARRFGGPSGLRWGATPSSGVLVISAARFGALACAAAFTAPRMEDPDADGGVADAHHWGKFIPVPLRPFRHDANFDWPATRGALPVGDDLQDALSQSARPAGCTPATLAMAPLLQADQTPAPAPEPATWTLLILGVAMLGLAARRRSRDAAVAG